MLKDLSDAAHSEAAQQSGDQMPTRVVAAKPLAERAAIWLQDTWLLITANTIVRFMARTRGDLNPVRDLERWKAQSGSMQWDGAMLANCLLYALDLCGGFSPTPGMGHPGIHGSVAEALEYEDGQVRLHGWDLLRASRYEIQGIVAVAYESRSDSQESHFIRLDRRGGWSHKQGQLEVLTSWSGWHLFSWRRRGYRPVGVFLLYPPDSIRGPVEGSRRRMAMANVLHVHSGKTLSCLGPRERP